MSKQYPKANFHQEIINSVETNETNSKGRKNIRSEQESPEVSFDVAKTKLNL